MQTLCTKTIAFEQHTPVFPSWILPTRAQVTSSVHGLADEEFINKSCVLLCLEMLFSRVHPWCGTHLMLSGDRREYFPYFLAIQLCSEARLKSVSVHVLDYELAPEVVNYHP